MKVQIRRAVFETNSSSVHTMQICNKEVEIPKCITSPLKFGFDIDPTMDKCSIQVAKRCNALFEKMIYDSDYYDYARLDEYLKLKALITRAAATYGLRCEFMEDPNKFDEFRENIKWEDRIADDITPMDVLVNMDEDMVMKFIFNDESAFITYDNNYFDPSIDFKEGFTNVIIEK